MGVGNSAKQGTLAASHEMGRASELHQLVPISKVRFKTQYTRKRGWGEILVTDPPLFSKKDKTYYKKLIINWNGNNIIVPHFKQYKKIKFWFFFFFFGDWLHNSL